MGEDRVADMIEACPYLLQLVGDPVDDRLKQRGDEIVGVVQVSRPELQRLIKGFNASGALYRTVTSRSPARTKVSGLAAAEATCRPSGTRAVM